MRFTPEQLRAIDLARLGEDACIVAGPGSGKTTVLVERIGQVIESGVDPSEILAITFTEKAAQSMRERLAKRFAHNFEILRKLEHASISTIHGYCSRVLRENATSAGVDPEFTILDEPRAVVEQSRALRDALDALYREKPDRMRALAEETEAIDLENALPPVYEAMRSAGVRPDRLAQIPGPPRPTSLSRIVELAKRYAGGFPAGLTVKQREWRDKALNWIERLEASQTGDDLIGALETKNLFLATVTNSEKSVISEIREAAAALRSFALDDARKSERLLLIEILERFDALYTARKAVLAALDFNDLESVTVRLLEEDPAARKHINAHFRLVVIDEFQDTSVQQSKLISLVRAPGRFYAVGDLNQSIYGFRHASPEVFQRYRDDVASVNGHLSELVENWRSRKPILLATRFLVNGRSGITERALVAARELPEIDTPAIEIVVARRNQDGDEYELEAAWIAHRIAELLPNLRLGSDRRPARLNDFAILVRNTAVLDAFLNAFDRAGLAYSLNRRSGFFETKEARDLLHLLRMIRNPRDEISTLVVLRSDFAGISDEGLLRLKRSRRPFAEALLEPQDVPLDAEDAARLERFAAVFQHLRESAALVSPDRLLLRALDALGIAWDPRSRRGENLEKFLRMARANAEATLGEFLDLVESMREANTREPDMPLDDVRDAIQIMTAHAAKGLEFPVVILAGMDKGVESQRSLLNFTPEDGLGARWRREKGAIYAANQTRLNEMDAAEANRLLYVALTRAQERLILSWSVDTRGKTANWAQVASQAFGLDAATPAAPGVRGYSAPDGEPFEARVHIVDAPPPVLFAIATERATEEILVVPKPSLSDQFELNATATALSQFASCPRKYYLGSYLGWRGARERPRAASGAATSGAAASNQRASALGSQVHALLAGEDPSVSDLEAIRMAQVFERSSLGRRAEKAARREREWDFVFGIGGLIVRGVIDLWFEDEKGLTLVDYKTDDIYRDHAAARARDYDLQLQVYAAALARALGKPPSEAVLYFLRLDLALPVPVRRASERVSEIAARLIEAQEAVDFPLNVGQHCRRCEFYRNLCPARLDATAAASS